MALERLWRSCRFVWTYSRFARHQHTVPPPLPPSTSSSHSSNLAGRLIGRLAVGGITCGFVGFGLYDLYARYERRHTGNSIMLEPMEPLPPSSFVTDANATKPIPPVILFQFTTCPFCCKVRAFLDYYGIPYDVVEVNSVTRTQVKWSKFRKVPIVLLTDVANSAQHSQSQQSDRTKTMTTSSDLTILYESSAIVSAIYSKLFYGLTNVDMSSRYPVYENFELNQKLDRSSRKKMDVPSRYNIMMGEQALEKRDYERLEDEKKWRRWVDDVFVHTISPNVYRSFSEAVQTFRWFDEHGKWAESFSWLERQSMVYVGATAMYFISKRLKRKYGLKPNVRQSLFDELDRWGRELSRRQSKYMGGAKPDLADLSLYGMLTAFEGCAAFQEAMEHSRRTNRWYGEMKAAVSGATGRNLVQS